MKYVVQIVEDDEMPDGRDVLIVERGPLEAAVMLLCGRPAQVWRAMREWEGSHEPCDLPSLLYAV